MTSCFSSCVNVGDSPVVPTAISPVIPAAICASTNFSNAAKSIPPSRNGVTKAEKVPRNIRLDLDRSFERKLSRAGECHVREFVPCSFEIDAQFASAADNNTDWPIDFFRCSKDQRARDNTCSARERFVFDTAFVSPH